MCAKYLSFSKLPVIRAFFILLLLVSCQNKPTEFASSQEDTSTVIQEDTHITEEVLTDTVSQLLIDSAAVEPDSTDVPVFKREGIYLYLSKPTMRLYVVNAQDSVLFSCGMACGIRKGDKRAEGDYRTPEGRYRICGIYESTNWVHKTRDGRKVLGCYGPYFLSLSTGKFQGIGIHGTNAPRSIGKCASEGCVRLLTKNIEAIYEHYAFIGMRVVISGERERLPQFKGLGAEYRSADELRASLSAEQLRKDSLKHGDLSTQNIAEPEAQSDSVSLGSDTLHRTSTDTFSTVQ